MYMLTDTFVLTLWNFAGLYVAYTTLNKLLAVFYYIMHGEIKIFSLDQ